jgi:ribosome biogenesis GTPase / thiamine phosphate phosphatase
MDLRSLGADASLLGVFEKTFGARGLILARVATAQRDIYRLLGGDEWTAEAAGRLWLDGTVPAVGDWVAARVVAPGQAIVEAVLPRRTLFARRAPGKREEQQAIAANIDVVFLVCGLDGDFNVRRLERYLTLAAESGAAPVVVLNKADCCADLAGAIEAAAAVSGSAPVVALTALAGGAGASACQPAAMLAGESACPTLHRGAAEALLPFAAGRTVALLGSSGVGKSTIVNRLLGEERLRTAEVREWDAKGRHTTTHRELVPLPGGGVLIDTPGMREIQLWAGEDAVESAFGDIAVLAQGCRFRDCSHTGEQGCAVEGAVDVGRLASFRKLMAEARHHEIERDRLAAAEKKRQWKVLHKAANRMYRNREKW